MQDRTAARTNGFGMTQPGSQYDPSREEIERMKKLIREEWMAKMESQNNEEFNRSPEGLPRIRVCKVGSNK
jgi:hypothetical protein